MKSLLHSGSHGQAQPVDNVSAVSHREISPQASSSQDEALAAGPNRRRRQLQRLAEVRRQEGISRRTIARRLGIGLREVRAQEQESADLPLSTLYRWQEILNVPISDLLEEDVGELSTPIMFRAKLLLVMKTMATILERTRNAATRRMAQFAAEKLIEIMPELQGMPPWPSAGKSCRRRELGRAAQFRLPADLMRDLDRR
jgi:transcriptional regulator with XRE-family HTH domain